MTFNSKDFNLNSFKDFQFINFRAKFFNKLSEKRKISLKSFKKCLWQGLVLEFKLI